MKGLKNKAWTVFSKWVRLSAADKHGIVLCVTCGSKHYWKDMQAGHFIHGKRKATFLMKENVHPQCIRCNHYLSGNLIKYQEYMMKKYKAATVAYLREASVVPWKPTRWCFEDFIKKYKMENGK